MSLYLLLDLRGEIIKIYEFSKLFMGVANHDLTVIYNTITGSVFPIGQSYLNINLCKNAITLMKHHL